MRHTFKGRVVELRSRRDGSIDSDALRRAAGIADNRQLILQTPDGRNRIINPGAGLSLTGEEFFTDAPKHDRGCSTLAAQA